MATPRKSRFALFIGILFLTTAPFVPHPLAEEGKKPREFQGIINAHEHFESVDLVPDFLQAMAQNGIEKTVIVGSPEETLLGGGRGFVGEDKYNLEVLKIAKQDPQHFIAFTTLNPKDPKKLKKLKRYLQMGAKGLKLYSGHASFHDLPLDDETMMPVYRFCAEKRIPILFHANVGYYQEEFENVLRKFPKLKIICPHFCLSTIKSRRFRHLMDHYPNLYTDVSFGDIGFLKAALLRFSRDPEGYRKLILQYQDRILFGTDLVVTRAPHKTVSWMSQMTRAYRDFLEKETYTFFGIEGMTLRGLHLDEGVLEKIYRKNFERFFNGK